MFSNGIPYIIPLQKSRTKPNYLLRTSPPLTLRRSRATSTTSGDNVEHVSAVKLALNVDTLRLGTIEILCGRALQGYSAVGHRRDTLRALLGYSVIGHCWDTLQLGTAIRLWAGEDNIDFKIEQPHCEGGEEYIYKKSFWLENRFRF